MPLKLSEAMRLGAMNRPQGRSHLLTSDGRTCAMGAAIDAIGLLATVVAQPRFNDYATPHPLVLGQFPILAVVVDNPAKAMYLERDTLSEIIAVLNDSAEWTREAIADFVETIERAQEPTSQPASRDLIGSVTS